LLLFFSFLEIILSLLCFWPLSTRHHVTIFKANPALLHDFREGKRAALEAVYWRYINLVASVARRGASHLCSGAGSLLLDEQRDLIQETFARAFQERTRLAYNGIDEYRPYLLAICRNSLMDLFRKRLRQR
jgi:DNA-directed RNA polymerase specialized sigma24 family protein